MNKNNYFIWIILFSTMCIVWPQAIKADTCYHEYSEGVYYSYYDNTYHKAVDVCNYCGDEKSALEKHDLGDTGRFETKDSNDHLHIFKCEKCDTEIAVPEKHDYVPTNEYEKKDGTNHYRIYECDICQEKTKVLEKHTFEETDKYKKVDDVYDAIIYQCEYCEQQRLGKKLKHNFAFENCKKLATPNKKGIAEYVCIDCKAKKKKQVKWKYNTEYSANYDIVSHSAVYSNSKTITLRLEKALKGSVIKVIIGKKTFSKKINNTKKKVTVKIKNPVYGSTIKVKLYYKGKLVGVDNSDSRNYVFYAKQIKIGMTKKQVKNLNEWGSPDRTGSSSGGWSFWYFDDGSWIEFKNGKVYSWYNAAG